MDLNAIKNDPNYLKTEPKYVEFAEVDDIWVRAYSIEKAKKIGRAHV